ncbi:hypothetical protein AXG93_3483s1010 [Marchantia polymorpha subsp. ruderalis]|uniref:Uncharacterized protein n=1 Tax=Marchantia polymorpha subsp. ruderalis TaxID=1480154 RepID=A0A176WBF1_MARPO|nr:hypothetical protein AXG93_3483s1010 [Marchantia polymorpha subsp. ruderalis]
MPSSSIHKAHALIQEKVLKITLRRQTTTFHENKEPSSALQNATMKRSAHARLLPRTEGAHKATSYMEPKRLGKDQECQANSEKSETFAGRADNEEGSFWKALRAHDIPCRPQRPSSPNTTPPVRHHLVFRIIPQNKRANLPRRSRRTRARQLPLGKISHRDDATTRQQFSRNNQSPPPAAAYTIAQQNHPSITEFGHLPTTTKTTTTAFWPHHVTDGDSAIEVRGLRPRDDGQAPAEATKLAPSMKAGRRVSKIRPNPTSLDPRPLNRFPRGGDRAGPRPSSGGPTSDDEQRSEREEEGADGREGKGMEEGESSGGSQEHVLEARTGACFMRDGTVGEWATGAATVRRGSRGRSGLLTGPDGAPMPMLLSSPALDKWRSGPKNRVLVLYVRTLPSENTLRTWTALWISRENITRTSGAGRPPDVDHIIVSSIQVLKYCVTARFSRRISDFVSTPQDTLV